MRYGYAAVYHAPGITSTPGESDSRGQPLALNHAHLERSVVCVYSRGEDGIAGNADDLVCAASHASCRELLSRIKRDIVPPADAEPGRFFEVARVAGDAGRPSISLWPATRPASRKLPGAGRQSQALLSFAFLFESCRDYHAGNGYFFARRRPLPGTGSWSWCSKGTPQEYYGECDC